MNPENFKFVVDGVDLSVEALVVRGDGPPIVFLHGFGSTKEEYADVAQLPEFANRTILAYDAPGCGRSTCSEPAKVTIGFLQKAAERMVEHLDLGAFHLIGHSMGGLTALRLAQSSPLKVLSFIDIEGNLAPEDCFFSRQILKAKNKDHSEFLEDFIDRVARSGEISNAFYAANLPLKINPEVVEPIFKSMVDLSDNEDLLGQFVGLAFPKMFVYGDRNKTLSYLPALANAGVELAEIPFSGHFPMYSNAHYLWQKIAAFIEKAEGGHDV